MEPYCILIVEDDKEIREGIEIYLRNQGYDVLMARDGEEGLATIESRMLQGAEIHLAIVDVMMPKMDGITMVMRVREKGSEFPVIMLSAKSEEVDKIMGLNMGADDYVTKPFTTMELLARVNSHLRRYGRFLKAMETKEQNDKETFFSVASSGQKMNYIMDSCLLWGGREQGGVPSLALPHSFHSSGSLTPLSEGELASVLA